MYVINLRAEAHMACLSGWARMVTREKGSGHVFRGRKEGRKRAFDVSRT